MNKDTKILWSSTKGDLRKVNDIKEKRPVNEKDVVLNIRRLTSGKGRTIIEVTGLPNNKLWCKSLAKKIKQKLAVGGAYKNNFIEIHGEKLIEVQNLLDNINIKYKKIGG